VKLSIKYEDSMGNNIPRLNLIKMELMFFPIKMLKWSIVWLKKIDELDMLHAKIYYN
jgi:hypothetical protein